MRTTKWARLVPELVVSDLATSLDFYSGVIGFRIAYDRPEDRFAYLDMDGAQLMLEQPDEPWLTGPLGSGHMEEASTSRSRLRPSHRCWSGWQPVPGPCSAHPGMTGIALAMCFSGTDNSSSNVRTVICCAFSRTWENGQPNP